MLEHNDDLVKPPRISEQDIIAAMKSLDGYIDITPGDFKQIYEIAYTMVLDRLLNTVMAAELMTKTVLVINQTMSLVQAASTLAKKQISGAPVVDDEKKIVGVVSEKDFLKEMGFDSNPSFMQIATHCLHDKSCMIKNLHDRTVADIMTKPSIVGSLNMTISDISKIFSQQKINRLPIVDEDNLVIGIVTRTDLAHAYHMFREEQKI